MWELYLQDGDSLGEVMLLHGGGGVQSSQRVIKLLQVSVAVTPMIQIVAQAGYQQAFLLQNKTKQRG